MRSAVVILAGLSLAACGKGQPAAAPTPTEQVAAAQPASDAEASVPVALDAAGLRRVCRAGLAAIHGQQVADIQVDGLDGDVVNASWRAPVDGGRMKAQCRVQKDLISWKPVDLPDPARSRWMNRAGDPAVRYSIDGDRITVTQTFPDGTHSETQEVVPAEEEAR